MANSMRCLSRMSFGIVKSNITHQFQQISKRTLFSESSMSMTEYKNTRVQVAEKYQAAIEGFKEKLDKSVSDEQGLVFTEDLKTLLHLADKNPRDLDLLKKVLDKFTNQNNEMRFGSFKFGTVVMRAFHYLNEPKVALEFFMNPKYSTFFNQLTTFMILLDLLYENKMYKEVRETYTHIKDNMLNNSIHPKLSIPVLAMACYRENTPESLETGLQVCHDLSQKGSAPLRRVVATLGALALNQNKPHVALELVALCRTIEYISIRCVRVMALADLDRIDDVVLEFQSALRRGTPDKYNYYSDIVTKVEAAIARLNIPENAQIVELLQTLQSRGYISTMTMESHLSLPIDVTKRDNNSPGKYQDGGWSDSRGTAGLTGGYNPNNRRFKRDTWTQEQQFVA